MRKGHVGGPLQTLADAADPCLGAFGGDWNGDGVVLFPRTHGDPIYSVLATSGEGAPVTRLDTSRQEHGHQWPRFLPDGRRFLYRAWGDSSELEGMRVGSLDPKEPARTLPVRSAAAYAEGPDGSGYLLFVRDQTLLAQPFDPKRLELTGQATGVAQPVGAFSVSRSGVLVYDAGGLASSTQLTWFDRAGRRLGTLGPPSQQDNPVLSPDEKHVAVSGGAVWVYEVASGNGSRLTFHRSGIPVWSPDSTRVVFESGTGDGIWKLYQKLSSGAGEEELVLRTTSREIWPVGWSHDGRYLLYGETGAKTHWDLWVLVNPLGPPAQRKTLPFLQTEFIEDFGQFSPDGKWVAYHSTESGRNEVYVRPFRPDGADSPGGAAAPSGSKWQVSRAGGVEPRWRGDGRELFYYGIDGRMMAVPVKTGDTFEVGTPQPLFWVRGRGYLRYDVSRDGQRFLVSTPSGESASALTVLLNWTARLKR